MLGSAAAGAGFGPAFAGALRTLAPLVAPTERAALLTAVYVLSYAAFSVPAVLAGAATTRFGLRGTADVYAAAVALVAAGAAAGFALRARRRLERRWCTSCSPYTGVGMPSYRALSCSAR